VVRARRGRASSEGSMGGGGRCSSALSGCEWMCVATVSVCMRLSVCL
jgi:hypothetical protein